MEAIKKWTIAPFIVEGRPQPTRHIGEVKFIPDGPALLVKDPGISSAIFDQNFKKAAHYKICGLNDLDKLPHRIKTVAPFLPESGQAEPENGFVKVEFFIASEGKVRAPGVLLSSSGILADSAIAAVSKWRFEPPMKNGPPVAVRAVQTLRFEFPD